MVITAGLSIFSSYSYDNDTVKYPYVQEYIIGQNNIKGSVDSKYYIQIDERFEIGANKDGYAVFKKPKLALEALIEKYPDGINLIKTELNLKDLSHKTYPSYKVYGWQTTSGSKLEKEQALFVSKFLDIYENSFEKPF